jgi:hypothetical protein
MYRTVEKTLKEVPAEEGIEVELVAVNTDEEARRHRFPGSPTICTDKHDIFPAREQEDYRLGRCVYTTSEGLKGSPTSEMLRPALQEAIRPA